ncbi:ribosome maturation factor RimP [Campylobacter sp. RM9344]|uniref:Ribosome maturation factor RimP n=1 Tax=Campylobacter californiensis TaxID=1032243 RepID=A0AAW3ZS61_9BACT|nr:MULTISPECIES: ribosome maturation factor RimP [unclassified Campylobacter]MBE2984383.1 ribosome maturation factor RimP [Campylobacter sp. RM6883]MBE2995818.1 ribosome maturation factor RimP [Campylobacter sp. RM6913]MBE3021769.1 ribosome maturation factor RimP [Campylobacter sp. 7477a]MBE3029649.1 ribosome maturation factor RimP [Campylobacter sp. RM9344]MBE3606203.1 ribosome maturation factor RimP [Campylobacter sp. RM13119]
MNELQELVKQCGVELYDTEIANENSKVIYRVYITKEGGVSLDECESVSRLLSPIFDVTPPVSGEYTLEVSSPGLERKLSLPKHFKASIGELVKVQAAELKILGRLVKADEENICIENDEGIFEIKILDIKKAKTYLEW